MAGKLSLGVLAALVIVLGVFLFKNYGNRIAGANQVQTAAATSPGTSQVQTATTNADWALKNTGNQIDGDISEAKKRFPFPGQKTLIDVSLTCVPKTKDIKIQIESYNDTAENGEAKGNPFVSQIDESLNMKPVGRIKFGTTDPVDLSTLFAVADYKNVISWDVEASAQTSAFFVSLLNHDPQGALSGNVGAGNYLQSRLPMVIEVKNGGGTEQVTIPSDNNAVNDVIQKCFVEKSTSPAATAPQITETVGGPAPDSAQPSSDQQSQPTPQSPDVPTPSDK